MACPFDARFLGLSGEQMPDARTLDRFLDRHEKRISELFIQIVQLAREMGLVKLGMIAVDGSKFQANSSRNKALSYGCTLTTLEALEHELKGTTRFKLSAIDHNVEKIATESRKRTAA